MAEESVAGIVAPRGDKDALRPVGTEFTYTYPQDMTNSASRGPTEWVYRVVEHVVAADFPGDTQGRWHERLEPVSFREVLHDQR